MLNKIHLHRFKRSAFMAAFMVFAFGGSLLAMAEPPGCDKQFFDLSTKKAEAKVAYDVATTEQSLESPKSSMAMTCFDKALSASAKKSSQIMGGDFTNNIKNVASTALSAIYNNFDKSDGLSYDTGFSGNPSAKLGEVTPYECDGIKKVQDKTDKDPLKTFGPFEDWTSDENKSDASSADAEDFNKSLQASSDNNIKQDVIDAEAALKQNDTFIAFSQDETPCEVLVKSGLNVSCDEEDEDNNGTTGGE